jgi:D-cysteine desulfhydrase family pyridoxal phosphate-dependent enzyme
MKGLDLVEDLRKRKETLFTHPTPLERMKNLSSLTGVEIFIKREDLIGCGFGGNKIRKMEYLIEDIKNKGADTVLTWGGIQSNWCRAMSSICRIFGIEPYLILFKRKNLPDDLGGNVLLENFSGAKISIVEGEGKKLIKLDDIWEIVSENLQNLEKMGRKTYLAPIGASIPEGSMEVSWGGIAYLDCFYELMEQCDTLGIEPDWIVHATGSGSTQAGLIAGSKLMGVKTKILGISVSETKEKFEEIVKFILENIQNYIQVNLEIKDEEIKIVDDYIGDGYGIVSRELVNSIKIVAEKEGIFLDPVYTGKAMVGLLDLINKGFFKKNEKIIFMHTGGLPALFSYKEKLEEFLKEQR